MTDRIVIELRNEAELQARLARAITGLQEPRMLLDRIGARLEQNIQFRFDTKRAPDGSAWLPLARSTREAYEAKYKGNVPGSLLVRTQPHLRDSLTHTAYDTLVDVGFGDPVALYHETGTRRGLPRRQLLTDDPIAGTLGADDRQDIFDEIEDYLAAL